MACIWNMGVIFRPSLGSCWFTRPSQYMLWFIHYLPGWSSSSFWNSFIWLTTQTFWVRINLVVSRVQNVLCLWVMHTDCLRLSGSRSTRLWAVCKMFCVCGSHILTVWDFLGPDQPGCELCAKCSVFVGHAYRLFETFWIRVNLVVSRVQNVLCLWVTHTDCLRQSGYGSTWLWAVWKMFCVCGSRILTLWAKLLSLMWAVCKMFCVCGSCILTVWAKLLSLMWAMCKMFCICGSRILTVWAKLLSLSSRLPLMKLGCLRLLHVGKLKDVLEIIDFHLMALSKQRSRSCLESSTSPFTIRTWKISSCSVLSAWKSTVTMWKNKGLVTKL
jgi:hypothetical protein